MVYCIPMRINAYQEFIRIEHFIRIKSQMDSVIH